jgi:putative peptidoglycan lipid II flippase
MPVFNSKLAQDDEDGAWKSANTFITVSIIFIIAFNIIGITFAPYFIPIVAPGLSHNVQAFPLTVNLTRVMFTAVTFTVLAGLAGGILNSYKSFTIPAFGPVLYNVGIIAGTLLLSKSLGIYGIAIGVVFGAVLNLSVMLPNFRKVGSRFRLALDFKDEGYKKMLMLMGPAFIGLSFSQVNLVVNQSIASVLSEGSITALRYSNRIILLPLGIFATSIALTVFPTLNTLIAKKEYDKFKSTMSLGLRAILFITIPSALGMIFLNVPIVRLLFKIGKFSEQDVQITAYALAFYSIGVIGQSAVQIVTRCYYSMQDTITPVKIGGLMVLANIVLNLFFVRFSQLALGGIALSYSITSVLNVVLLYWYLSKKLNGLPTPEIISATVKAFIASLVMGFVAAFVVHTAEAWLGTASKLSQLIEVGLACCAGALVFFIIAYALKMPELHYMLNMLKRKRASA